MQSELKSLSQESPISKRTEPAFLKPRFKVTKVSSIEIEVNAIELNSSRGTFSSFSSIAIELKLDGLRALRNN